MKQEHKNIKRKLSIAKGQLDGIIKMIDNEEYCINISDQILAVISLLKNANRDIISNHLSHCVKNCKDDEELDRKIDEIKDVIDRMSR